MGRGRYKKKQNYQKGVDNVDENFVEALNECEEPIFVAEEPVVEVEPEVQIVESRAPLFKVRVTHPLLNKRAAPAADGVVVGKIINCPEVLIYDSVNGWGELEDESWINLAHTEQI